MWDFTVESKAATAGERCDDGAHAHREQTQWSTLRVDALSSHIQTVDNSRNKSDKKNVYTHTSACACVHVMVLGFVNRHSSVFYDPGSVESFYYDFVAQYGSLWSLYFKSDIGRAQNRSHTLVALTFHHAERRSDCTPIKCIRAFSHGFTLRRDFSAENAAGKTREFPLFYKIHVLSWIWWWALPGPFLIYRRRRSRYVFKNFSPSGYSTNMRHMRLDRHIRVYHTNQCGTNKIFYGLFSSQTNREDISLHEKIENK